MPYVLKDSTNGSADDKIKELMTELGTYIAVLRLIASPKRPDGTFNRDREACQKLAEETLKHNRY